MKFTIVFMTFLATGCATNVGTGVIAGATLGASAGGMVGGGSGAVIGSAAAVVTGGLLGAILDRQDRKVIEKNSPRTVDRIDRQEPLTISDVIKLTQSGISDDAILHYLNETKSFYQLSQAQVRRLHESGVSQRVINFMMHARQM